MFLVPHMEHVFPFFTDKAYNWNLQISGFLEANVWLKKQSRLSRCSASITIVDGHSVGIQQRFGISSCDVLHKPLSHTLGR
jgi:hypothetical protein